MGKPHFRVGFPADRQIGTFRPVRDSPRGSLWPHGYPAARTRNETNQRSGLNNRPLPYEVGVARSLSKR